ncbi:hypothetical protein ACF0H5_011347 [Mactra antiquata]
MDDRQDLKPDNERYENRSGEDTIDSSDLDLEMKQLEMCSTKELIEHLQDIQPPLQNIQPLLYKSKQELSQASEARTRNTMHNKEKVLKLEMENEDILKELQEKEDTIKRQKDEFEKSERNADIKIAKLQQKINDIETEMIGAKTENNALKEELKASEKKKLELQKECDETKSRLSRIIGEKLTDNIPDIAELSDENRPTKIAERYSELFDNEWTDAYEAVEEIIKDENATISCLLRTLKFIMKQCVRIAEQHSVKITEAVYYTECMPSTVHTEIKKPIKDIRKVAAPFTSKQVQEELLNSLIKKGTNESLPAIHKKVVQEYIKKCTNICWLMVVQDPPLFFDLDVTEYEEFDKSRYREYTKSGTKIEFLVWPAMYLKKGTLLVKGIAQGYGAKDQTRPQTAPPAFRSDVSSPRESQLQDTRARQDLRHTVFQSHSGYTGQTQDRNYEQSTNSSLLQDKSSYMSKSIRSTPTHQGNAYVNITNRADFYKYPPPDVPQEKWKSFLYYTHRYGPDSTLAKTSTRNDYQRCLSQYEYLLYGGTTA